MNYVLIDVGGGSTEITLFQNNRVHTARSFQIGSVRLLKNKVATIDKKQLNDKNRAEKEIADREFKNKMSAISNELKAKLKANKQNL